MSLTNNHFKTFLITLLSLTLLFSISCSDAYKPNDEDGTRTLSYYAGNWFGIFSEESGETNIFTINADGSVIMRLGGNETVPSTSITKNSDTSYTYHDAGMNASMHFNFTSDTEGTITLEDIGSGSRMDYPVTKK